jgi:hypothetical protein
MSFGGAHGSTKSHQRAWCNPTSNPISTTVVISSIYSSYIINININININISSYMWHNMWAMIFHLRSIAPCSDALHQYITIVSSNRTATEMVCFGMARSETPSAPNIITGQSQEPDREFWQETIWKNIRKNMSSSTNCSLLWNLGQKGIPSRKLDLVWGPQPPPPQGLSQNARCPPQLDM